MFSKTCFDLFWDLPLQKMKVSLKYTGRIHVMYAQTSIHSEEKCSRQSYDIA